MPGDILTRLRSLLEAEGIAVRVLQHEPTRTSEESARVRGEDLKIGAKAILLKTDDTFRLFVISAALRLDSKAVKSFLGIKSLRFATREELYDLTGLEPGAVPPFGHPILPFDLFADPSVLAHERVAFNAGSLTDSIIMSAADYQRAARPTFFAFAQTE